MNKIGIAIQITLQGVREPIVANGGNWNSKKDIRSILAHVPSFGDDTNMITTFISFDRTGCYITVARPISGRPLDNVAGFIYIHNSIIIDGAEVDEIINRVKQLISKSELPDEAKLQQLFSKEYPTKKHPQEYAPSCKEEIFAVRDTGYFSIKELFDHDRYQQYYSKYTCIFLTDDISIIKDAEDLTQKPLKKFVTVLPPQPQNIITVLGRGITITHQGGKPFDTLMQFEQNKQYTACAQKEGFEPVAFEFIADKDEMECPLPKDIQWKKIISADQFVIKSQVSKPIEDVKIYINGKDISHNPIALPQQECVRAEVMIEAYDHDPYTGSIDLWNLQDTKNITLSPKRETIQTTICLANGETGEISITAPDIDKYTSPIKYYVFRKKGLVVNKRAIWQERLIGFGAALIIFLMGFAVAFTYDLLTSKKDEDSKAKTEETAQAESKSTEQDNVDSRKEAIDYLDNNTEWKRADMEKIQLLKGLFDDINERHIEDIIRRQNDLKDSKQFMELINTLNSLQTNTPRNNDVIIISDLINALKEQSKESTNKSGHTDTDESSKTTADKDGNTKNKKANAKKTSGK